MVDYLNLTFQLIFFQLKKFFKNKETVEKILLENEILRNDLVVSG